MDEPLKPGRWLTRRELARKACEGLGAAVVLWKPGAAHWWLAGEWRCRWCGQHLHRVEPGPCPGTGEHEAPPAPEF